MIDIIRHRKIVKVSEDFNLIGDIKRNKLISTSSEVNRKSSITPKINLPLFDDLNEDRSDDSNNSADNLAHRSSITKSSTNMTQEVATRYDEQLSRNSQKSITFFDT
jgi:outer membrane protein TolC